SMPRWSLGACPSGSLLPEVCSSSRCSPVASIESDSAADCSSSPITILSCCIVARPRSASTAIDQNAATNDMIGGLGRRSIAFFGVLQIGDVYGSCLLHRYWVDSTLIALSCSVPHSPGDVGVRQILPQEFEWGGARTFRRASDAHGLPAATFRAFAALVGE